MILFLDNYDSFVANLARYFVLLGQETKIVRSDAIDAEGVKQLRPRAIVISPGPCTPREAGCSVEVVQKLYGDVPMLGVCLGHQAIAAAFGAKIIRAAQPMHGRTTTIAHDRQQLFANLPNPLTVCRYHSLVVDENSLPNELQITARAPDGTIMALAHRTSPTLGVQFHPESILTECGFELLANFLRLAGLRVPSTLPRLETAIATATSPISPTVPITF
jgi:anthranilate synthase/aminodeoxychorismate synthase-like glutamine amidotransferase